MQTATLYTLFTLIVLTVVEIELFVWTVNKALQLVIHCWFVLAEAFSVLLSGNSENIVSTVPWEGNKTLQPAEEKLYVFCSAAFLLLDFWALFHFLPAALPTQLSVQSQSG